WHPSKSDREIFALGDLVKEFRLENVQKSGAIFDLAKLDWMNGEYIRKKSPGEILKIAESLGIKSSEKIIALEQPRLKKLSELPEKTDYFFKEPEYSKELLRWKGEEDYPIIKKHLEKICELLPEREKIMAYAEKEGRGEVLWPFRVSLSGMENSPGPFEIAEILGKQEVLRRLERALRLLD
ncbi:MAG: glutamate--tRNA ligase, partial [bacterium]|nr:glutamate--tRNA ligase [bacterium]